MDSVWVKLLIICPLVFLGGLIDSIAGGGGLIALPAYLFAGLPPHMALATNKFSSSIGTVASVFRFIKYKSVHAASVAAAVVCALAGSAAGAQLALFLSAKILQYVLLLLLPAIAVFLFTRKNPDFENESRDFSDKRAVIASAISGFVIGAYDGFFGPGAGTFYILAFVFLAGLGLRTSMGNAKLVNLASNLGALVVFLIGGQVWFLVGIPAALFGVLGHTIGSGLAIKNGAKVFRPAFALVFALLAIKIVGDLLGA